jgi:uncharacterized glyoxalase superfamily protein PhnB
MKFQTLSPNLAVRDVNATVAFYEKTFGFELLMSVPETGEFHWAMMQGGNISIMFQEERNLKSELVKLDDQPIGGAFTLYIRMEGLKEFYDQLQGKCDIAVEWHSTFYGADEFTVRDINGYFLTFSQEAEGGS